jgi:hypothetical protein
MDDARIRELTEEVLADLRRPPSADEAGLVERVTALEAAVRGLQAALATQPGAATPAAPVSASVTSVVTSQVAQRTTLMHPSFQLLGAAGPDGERCSMEPDKPCVGSGACRTFGH